MPSRGFLLFSGLMLCLSGAAYLLDTAWDALDPANSPGLGAFVPVFGLIGFTGFWLTLRAPVSLSVSLIFYGTAMAGLAGLASVTFLVNRVLPHVPPQSVPEILVAVRTEFLIIGVVFLISGLLAALVCWGAGAAFRFGASIYAIGAIPVSMPPLMPPPLVTLGGALIGFALLIWGLELVKRNRRPAGAVA